MNLPKASQQQSVSRWHKLAMLLPVILLISVALNEPRLHLQDNLTSWKGGGFGMFATLDRHTYRPIVVNITFQEKTMQVDFRSYRAAIENDVNKVQHLEDTFALPSQHNLSVLAKQMAEMKYNVDNEFAIASNGEFGIPISYRQISIELYRIKYDAALNTGSWIPLTSWPEEES